MSRISRETYFESVYADALEQITDLELELTKSVERAERAEYIVNTMFPAFKECAPDDAKRYAGITPELKEYFEFGGDND